MTLQELRDFVASPQVASLHPLTEVRMEPLAVDSRGYIAPAAHTDDQNSPTRYNREGWRPAAMHSAFEAARERRDPRSVLFR